MPTRKVAGCVPIRKGEKGIEVLLVESRRKQGRWLFPKGGVKKSEKANEAAVRETYEVNIIQENTILQL